MPLGTSSFAARRVYPWLTGFWASPHKRTPRWAYGPVSSKIPAPTFTPAWGWIDPALIIGLVTTGVEAGTSITVTAMQAKAAKKAAEAEKARAKAEKAAAKRAEAEAAAFQPSIQPSQGPNFLVVGIGAIALGGVLYLVATRNRRSA